MSLRDPLDPIPAGCVLHELDRCPACTAPIVERGLAGRPALWDAVSCDHRHGGCAVSYALHTPGRCDTIRAHYDQPAPDSGPVIERRAADGDWDTPDLRPISVRRVDGDWVLFDHGGALQIRLGVFGTPVPLPEKTVCCWDAAQGLADALARHYRGEPPPGWVTAGGHPPVRPGRVPCPRGVSVS